MVCVKMNRERQTKDRPSGNKGRAPPPLCELRLYITDGRQWFWCMIGGQCWRLAGGGLELVHCPRGQDTMEQWPAPAASAAW